MVRALAAAAAAVLALTVGVAAVFAGPPPAPPPPAPSAVAAAEIPPELLVVYQDAARRCEGLPWQVLAAIGWVESRHGKGRVDARTGEVSPPIVGPAIDGRPGFAAIADPTQPDGWAHAVGPMQFLTTTFVRWAVVAPGRPAGATPSPHNAWDAIHTAAVYLCAGRERLDSIAAAVLRYNHSQQYLDGVLDKAAEYAAQAAAPPAGGAPAGDAVAVRQAVVTAAMTAVGTPYLWGGNSPGGFDCSGLVQWAYAQAGIALPRTTAQQVTVGVPVDVGDLEPGDLLFSRGGRAGEIRDLGHVAIYIGGGQQVVAPATGRNVEVQPVRPDRVQAVRRVIGR